jgi:hypothetical protein
MSDCLIETPPTKEAQVQYGKNLTVSGGRMAQKVPRIRYRNLFDLINDPDCDALPDDYTASFDLFLASHYAFRQTFHANAGHRADTAGDGTEGELPLADLYSKLSKRFSEQLRATRRFDTRSKDHWQTLAMLEREVGDIDRNRSALFVILNDIITALDLLQEYQADIAREWKKAQTTS